MVDYYVVPKEIVTDIEDVLYNEDRSGNNSISFSNVYNKLILRLVRCDYDRRRLVLERYTLGTNRWLSVTYSGEYYKKEYLDIMLLIKNHKVSKSTVYSYIEKEKLMYELNK